MKCHAPPAALHILPDRAGETPWLAAQSTICIATASGGPMVKKRKGSRKPKSQKTLDPRVEDLRKKILHLDPYSGWFPAGATKRIMSIVDKDLEPIGELETGSDGFVQLAVLVGRRFVRISYYPGQPYAALTWITLEKKSNVHAIADWPRISAYGYLSSQGLRGNHGAERMRQVSGLARLRGTGVLVFTFAALVLFAMPASAAAVSGTYTVTALVSNNGVPGTTVGARLVNAWGLVAGPGTPWWVSDNGADFSTLYNATGVKRNLNVSVDGAPTGIVFNGAATSFRVGPSNAGALFIFATEGGTIAGWNPSLGTASQVKADASGAGAVYKGLTMATTATGPQLYATDFHNARIDVFNATWAAVTPAGGFVDPKIPAGYAPFGIQTIGAQIFVTFAKQGPGAKDEIDGQGLGFVDAFDTDGNLLLHVAQRGQLNAPWGLALAPASFGRFGGGLLVGNFGDGHVNAYQELPDGTFELIGALRTADGRKP